MKLKEDLLFIKDAALRAVDPYPAVKQRLSCDRDAIRVGDLEWSFVDVANVYLIAAGKAAIPMAQAAADTLGTALSGGIVVTKHEHAGDHHLPPALRVIEAGHPVPDRAGLEGASAIANLLSTTTGHDRVLLLLSGGASALLPLPAEMLTLADLQATTDLLLRAGATIGEINTIRKHLSRLKGGQLARLAAPAPVAALILSDVVGDPLDVIASGPTAPDISTYDDALTVLRHYNLALRVPLPVQQHLARGAAGEIAETPKPGDPIFNKVTNIIVGSNRLAALAAVDAARVRGYQTLLLSTFVEGEAREIARMTAALAKSIRAHGDPITPPACLVWGGETTVTVRGRGKGGRNQELALAVAGAVAGMSGVALMALATDGTDGPTDAAGAIVDGNTAQCAQNAGCDLNQALHENDAYPVLDTAGALLRTGPTGTNVNDLTVLLVI